VRDLAMAHWKTALAEGVHLVVEPVLAGIMLIEDDLIPEEPNRSERLPQARGGYRSLRPASVM
jgi:hypothetical protein